MTRQTLHIITAFALLMASCQSYNSTTDKQAVTRIDKSKRDQLVKKYDLMKFPNIKQPILLTVDEFFDGNNDQASIAPNLEAKLPMTEYYKVLKSLSVNPKTIGAFAEIKDVMIYDNGQLKDDEWFYTDIIYFVGDLTKEEIKEATNSLQPDEVEYDTENRITGLSEKYKGKKVVYVWWD
jgi:hypothetical protein